MRVRIVTGFLGAGKTTFIKKAIAYEQSRGLKVAVLVNEFGDIGFDGLEITQGNEIEVTELAKGCICCSLKGDLVKAVTEIETRYHPEMLLVEPSGISSPKGILEAIELVDFAAELQLEPIIALVDGSNFLHYWEEDVFGSFMKEQITMAQVVVINKIDLISDKLLQMTENLLQKINPEAILIPTLYGDAASVLELISEKSDGVTENHKGETAVTGSVAGNVKAVTLPVGEVIDVAKLSGMFEEMADTEYGRLIRCKGLLKTKKGSMLLSYVPHQLSLTEMKLDSAEYKLVFIGVNLNKELIEKRLRQLEAGSVG